MTSVHGQATAAAATGTARRWDSFLVDNPPNDTRILASRVILPGVSRLSNDSQPFADQNERTQLQFCLLPRHGHANGYLRRDEVIQAHSILGDGELNALYDPVEFISTCAIVE